MIPSIRHLNDARPSNARMLRPGLALLLALAFLAIPYSQAIPGLPSLSRAPTVEILHAGGASSEGRDAYPFEAAEEARLLLQDLAGIEKVRLVPAAGIDAFLDAARASRADVLVLVAHGSPDGLEIGGGTLAWSALREALAHSGAREILVASCDADLVGEVPGKRVRGLFEGVVDRRLVGPTVAYEAAQVLPPHEYEAFRMRFYERLGGDAGLQVYAVLKLFPQEPMSPCRDRLDDWYAGRDVSGDSGGCIHHISSTSLNCHKKSNSQVEACRSITPEGQDQMNSGTPSAGVGFMPDCSWGAWGECLANVFQFNASFPGNNEVKVKFGIPNDFQCITILSLQAIMSGGTTTLLRAVLNSIASSRTIEVGADADVGIRICGNFSGNVDIPNGSDSVSFSGKGHLDMVAFGTVGVTYAVRVFGRDIAVTVGAEAGGEYPLRPEVKAQLIFCKPNGGLGFTADASVDGGPASIFLNAVAIWKEIGFSHAFGGEFHTGLHYALPCPEPSAAGAAAPGAPPARAAPWGVYADLVQAGLARVNDAPTVLRVDESGTQTTLNALFLTLRPGSGDYNHYAESGALDALGVPARLPPGAAVLLDLANPRVREALGMEAGQAVTPWISLVDGVAVVDGRAALGQATRSFCSDLPGNYPELETLACEGVDPDAPVQAVATTSRCSIDILPVGVHLSPQGALTAGAYGPQVCGIEGDDPTTYFVNGATAAACDPPADLVCLEHNRLVGKDGALTGLALWSRIHNTAKMLDRPTEAVVWVEGCTAAALEAEGVADLCLAADAYADLQKAPGTVVEQYTHGKVLLAEYAPSFAKTWITTVAIACGILKFKCGAYVEGDPIQDTIDMLP